MIKTHLERRLWEISYGKLFLCLVLVLLAWPVGTAALGSQQNPQSGSQGVQGSVSGPPPAHAPTVATPTNGETFNSIPITVSGLCQTGLLVKVYSNNVFVGAAQCTNGSYSLKVDLFSGQNQITVQQFDALDQGSPVSSVVTVTYDDAQFTQFGTVVSLSSNYAERGANPGQLLTWPIILSGGVGPYALSIDWGDGSPTQLLSEQFPGTVTISHTYTNAGTYNILIKAVDKNGTTAYLQVIAVINGHAAQTSVSASPGSTSNKPSTKLEIVWWPSAISIILCMVSFWLGRKYELSSLRRRIEKSSRA